MSDRGDLDDRLDAVEQDLGDSSVAFGPGMVYATPDGYLDLNGDPVPTDDDGDPVPPDTPDGVPVIVFDGRYDPRPGETMGEDP